MKFLLVLFFLELMASCNSYRLSSSYQNKQLHYISVKDQFIIHTVKDTFFLEGPVDAYIHADVILQPSGIVNLNEEYLPQYLDGIYTFSSPEGEILVRKQDSLLWRDLNRESIRELSDYQQYYSTGAITETNSFDPFCGVTGVMVYLDMRVIKIGKKKRIIPRQVSCTDVKRLKKKSLTIKEVAVFEIWEVKEFQVLYPPN